MSKNITKMVYLLLPLVVLFTTKPVVAEPSIIVNPVNLSRNEQINYFSELYGVDSNMVNKVIECESGGNHSTVGDSGYSNGIMQFQKSTFYRMAKIFGEELNYKSEYDQIKLGVYALSKPELAREWTTYVAIQKGGTYKFYSSQLGKNFTVKCSL